MKCYFGSEQQIKLQQVVDEFTPWCAKTKGAVNGGRFLGVDDIEALGWDRIIEFLERGGAFTFRMVPTEGVEEINARLQEHGMRFDYWNVFSAQGDAITRHTGPINAEPLPGGFSLVANDELGDEMVISEIQQCMARNNVVPFSGNILSGQALPSSMVALRDRHAKIVATAFGYFPYNRFSKWSSTAWGGLVAVDPELRGRKLGVRVNALMVEDCVNKLGASEVQEFAAATNIPSRRMIERCGLVLDPSVVCGIATSGAERFTR